MSIFTKVGNTKEIKMFPMLEAINNFVQIYGEKNPISDKDYVRNSQRLEEAEQKLCEVIEYKLKQEKLTHRLTEVAPMLLQFQRAYRDGNVVDLVEARSDIYHTFR